MGLFELVLIAIGLSMDAFAVSVCKGLGMNRVKRSDAFLIAFFFGAFQCLMPIIGWVLGAQFEKFIVPVDHWIAFVLLGIIGVQMIREALEKDEGCAECGCQKKLKIGELTLLAIATSIDALVIGITFGLLSVKIIPSASLIGVITFLISFAGVYIGNRFGTVYKKKAELTGGIILILIGLKVLVEHLFF